ncbi:DUF63 family protein [Methanococcus voltae]|uniref:DUF63 family protein n=1 Tax=Methanococcus voltae (strain ATCC BAA-1334 / A3) TaxID=456320 RepID=D7DR95_METV3|nr:DUF63 family protein [Methanococcus voltae]MCS3901032.1 putative membrane protein [Methanococcus voltae]
MDIIQIIDNFIYEHYIYPIEAGTGYNLVQEFTYGILLFVMVYLFYKIAQKFQIEIDEKFAKVTIVYIILITLMRALVDAGVIERLFFTVTPGIVILIGAYYLLSLIISGALLKKKYYIGSIVMAVIPILYFLYEFVQRIVHIEALTLVALILAISYILAIFILTKIKKSKIEKLDKYTIFSQLVDASATSVGIAIYGYWEQHPVPRFFMDLMGPYVMIPLKLIVVVLVLELFNREVENKNLRNILKIAVLSLGLAPGLRNLFRTIMGV